MEFYQFFLISICNCIFLLCSTSKAQTASGAVPAMKLKIEFPNGVSPCRNTKIDGKNCIFGNLFGKLAIKCVNDGGPWNNSMSLTWYQSKDDENPNTSNYELVKGTDDGRVKVSDGLLEISQLSNSDIAYYACKVTLKRSISEKEELVPLAQEVVEVQALPLVTPAVKDTTVVEGNTINVTCSVTGKASGVSWKFGGKPIDVNDSRVTMHPFKGVANATVLIQHANSTTDRGLYNCTAYSRYGNSKEGSIHVRIKSKYAALAPFLGIVAEVIILCTIILIYEKKRDKTELEESDTDQGPETKSSPDHGQDSVRYRK